MNFVFYIIGSLSLMLNAYFLFVAIPLKESKMKEYRNNSVYWRQKIFPMKLFIDTINRELKKEKIDIEKLGQLMKFYFDNV